MKYFAQIILLFFLSTACSDSAPEKKVQEAEIKPVPEKAVDKQVDPIEKKVSETDAVIQTDTDFNAFWEKFRKAVEKDQMEEITKMTQFPFVTRGEMDMDPEIKFSKKEFARLLPKLLDQYAGMDLEGTSEAGLVIKTKKVDPEEINRESVRVGSLVFDQTKTGWKFTFAYVNAPVYKQLGIDIPRLRN